MVARAQRVSVPLAAATCTRCWRSEMRVSFGRTCRCQMRLGCLGRGSSGRRASACSEPTSPPRRSSGQAASRPAAAAGQQLPARLVGRLERRIVAVQIAARAAIDLERDAAARGGRGVREVRDAVAAHTPRVRERPGPLQSAIRSRRHPGRSSRRSQRRGPRARASRPSPPIRLIGSDRRRRRLAEASARRGFVVGRAFVIVLAPRVRRWRTVLGRCTPAPLTRS